MEPTASDLYKKILCLCNNFVFISLQAHKILQPVDIKNKKIKKLLVYNQFPLIEMYSFFFFFENNRNV